jgi:predicted transposase/invertase (TIGR01784 family)
MAQANTKLQIQDPPDVESTRRAYFLREKARNDYVSAMTLATRKSKAEGIQEGEQRGEQRGILKGKQEGRQERDREIIKGMSGMGLPIEKIAELISLTPQEVSKLII